eukprot:CAMPEP_0170385054 /NCGR_PEP_ID=MMETSP0117_2-20130122/16316_1 /TAXON_ID=400756 /ORGANISM="Durinskia baltica, Strain CSIRO CS-38" /LENGTH=442 /DNA_ID=CAMNT_0010640823 /DNA_START=115 /DNA_END=1443 /DNA_ORIENTATION=+
MSVPAKLRIGLFGGGVVGGGVCELVQNFLSNGRLAALGSSIEIVKICVLNINKERDFKLCKSYKYVLDKNEILHDDSINCVVELIGGTTDAKEITLSAIRSGKHVVSANKALIASCLGEIEAALSENPSVQFGYEAAVCGGIPIINTLQTDFLSDQITKIMGIMNGTTNFMLCKMEDEGADYGTVLREAQSLGFAEADPTADVEGHDVQAKIALLAKLAFGKSIPIASVPTTGISQITSADFAFAKMLNSTIKLLGTAILLPAVTRGDQARLSVFVSPTLVCKSSPLANAKGPGNAVLINSDNMGVSTLSGPGAGRYPTANSVLNDLIRISLGRSLPPFPLNSGDALAIDSNYQSKFYVRIKCTDGLGIIRAVGVAAETACVSIHSIHQNESSSSNCGDSSGDVIDFVVTTDVVALKHIQDFAAAVSKLPIVKESPLFMPII